LLSAFIFYQSSWGLIIIVTITSIICQLHSVIVISSFFIHFWFVISVIVGLVIAKGIADFQCQTHIYLSITLTTLFSPDALESSPFKLTNKDNVSIIYIYIYIYIFLISVLHVSQLDHATINVLRSFRCSIFKKIINIKII